MATAARGAGAARAAKAGQAADTTVAAPSRREFLYYIWGASILMLGGELTAGTLWFAFPRFREGEFGGTFSVDPAEIPAQGASPVSKPEGRFWLSYPEEGFVALYAVCTHLGCLPSWNDQNFRFECPCHGSKYELDGKYIEGPAPRSLDRFFTTLTFSDGTTAESNGIGDPIPVEGRTITSVQINTGSRILRPGKD